MLIHRVESAMCLPGHCLCDLGLSTKKKGTVGAQNEPPSETKSRIRFSGHQIQFEFPILRVDSDESFGFECEWVRVYIFIVRQCPLQKKISLKN